MMTAYNQIHKQSIAISWSSVLWDIIDKNNPYYTAIRQAEVLWFISWVPQKNGWYNFEWQRNIKRAEFAKIISVPFGQELFDVTHVVLNSDVYASIITSLDTTKSDKKVFLYQVMQWLESIKDDAFIKTYKIQKKLFLERLQTVLIDTLSK